MMRRVSKKETSVLGGAVLVHRGLGIGPRGIFV